MTSIEILALIFAVLVLVKLIVILIRPKAWGKFVAVVWSKAGLTMLVCLVLAVITGYYVLNNLSIVEVGAVMLFTSTLMAVAWGPYSKLLLKMKEEVLKPGAVQKSWLPIIIWLVLGVWILYSILT